MAASRNDIIKAADDALDKAIEDAILVIAVEVAKQAIEEYEQKLKKQRRSGRRTALRRDSTKSLNRLHLNDVRSEGGLIKYPRTSQRCLQKKNNTPS